MSRMRPSPPLGEAHPANITARASQEKIFMGIAWKARTISVATGRMSNEFARLTVNWGQKSRPVGESKPTSRAATKPFGVSLATNLPRLRLCLGGGKRPPDPPDSSRRTSPAETSFRRNMFPSLATSGLPARHSRPRRVVSGWGNCPEGQSSHGPFSHDRPSRQK